MPASRSHHLARAACHWRAHLQLAASLCELMIPYYTSKIIFAVTQQVPEHVFKGHLAAYGVCAFGFAAFAAGRGALFSVINNKLSRALRCVVRVCVSVCVCAHVRACVRAQVHVCVCGGGWQGVVRRTCPTPCHTHMHACTTHTCLCAAAAAAAVEPGLGLAGQRGACAIAHDIHSLFMYACVYVRVCAAMPQVPPVWRAAAGGGVVPRRARARWAPPAPPPPLPPDQLAAWSGCHVGLGAESAIVHTHSQRRRCAAARCHCCRPTDQPAHERLLRDHALHRHQRQRGAAQYGASHR
jgi:hypothetical protein